MKKIKRIPFENIKYEIINNNSSIKRIIIHYNSEQIGIWSDDFDEDDIDKIEKIFREHNIEKKE